MMKRLLSLQGENNRGNLIDFPESLIISRQSLIDLFYSCNPMLDGKFYETGNVVYSQFLH